MPIAESALSSSAVEPVTSQARISHLRLLEAESIHILREVASEFERPVMLYSIGKDSSVMLRLAQKAFYPGPIPFPLMHIDTGFKFREMIAFRDDMARQVGAELLVWRNEGAIAALSVRRGIWRSSARRREVARQGAHLLVPRPCGAVGSEKPAAGALEH